MAEKAMNQFGSYLPGTSVVPFGANRRHLVIAALIVALALTACARDPVRPGENLAPGAVSIDFPLAWSRDGQWIAFRRPIPSSYGPPGMYLVHRTGSIVRYVYGPADLFFPDEASFSPDGRFIAAVDSRRQLIIVDVASLEVRRPLYTLADVYSTDWSPDGKSILYSLFYSGNPATTSDSLGLFLFDVDAGTTRPLRWGPEPILSYYPRWSPDGGLIAMDELVAPFRALSVMNSDGTGHRFVIPPRSLQVYSDIDWFRPVPSGAARIYFWNSPSPKVGAYLINPDGTGLTPFWHRMRPGGILSPTGTEYARTSPDPSTNYYWVLHVGPVNDFTDLSLRQITRYEPLVLSPAVLEGEGTNSSSGRLSAKQ